MLVITEEDNIAFVVVEGREDRGFGMDLVQLAAYAKRRFNAKFAINLDGGRSSRIIIRKPGDSSVYTMTDTMKMKYPSGDLIAFTRDRV
jgi:exopolysaccharide biosynthesis protein